MLHLLTFDDLKHHGVVYTRDHLRRLCDAGRFPKPIKIALGGRRIGWIAEEIETHLAQQRARRNAE
jgi:predicted DNA-binding transcriptional regulator AlpA